MAAVYRGAAFRLAVQPYIASDLRSESSRRRSNLVEAVTSNLAFSYQNEPITERPRYARFLARAIAAGAGTWIHLSADLS